MIVRSNFDAAGDLIEHGVIAAAVSELQFEGLAAERTTENLLSETDAEDGHLANQAAHLSGLKFEGLRIAGTIGEEDAIGLESEHVLSRSHSGHNRDARADVHKAAQDVVLN